MDAMNEDKDPSFNINLEDYKLGKDITPNDIKKFLDPVLDKMNLSSSFYKSDGAKLLDPKILKLFNNSIFPAENFLEQNIFNDPVKVRDTILFLDDTLFYIIQKPELLNSMNENKTDLSKIIRNMIVVFFRKASLLKKVKSAWLDKKYLETLSKQARNTNKFYTPLNNYKN